MSRVRLLILLASLSCIGPHALSQTAEQMILLQKNPGLAETVKSRINNQKTLEASSGGVPTSKEPRELNANDSLTDPSLLTQSIAPADPKGSVIQQYYRVLSEQSLPIYGSSEFSQTQDTSLLFFNTAGKNYRLAAGDVVRVTIRGRTMDDATHKIGRDGNLILSNLAPVAVSGSTIGEAEEKLLDILRLDDAAAAVFISLETARLITVQVSGAVASPRTIAVPAYTPLSRVLAYAGGINPTGSLRNIVLRDQDGNTQSIDFYDFLQSPTGSNDPLVTDSSRIFVGNQGRTIGAIGFVARPGIYELQQGSDNISVAELLKLTGTSIIPPGAEFEAVFFDENGITSKRKIDHSGFLNAGEILNIRFVETKLQGSIEVVGAVLNEFKVASSEPVSLQKLLKNGSVLSSSTNPEKANAFLDFSLMISNSGKTQAISLRDKLKDPKFLVSPDTKLVVLDTADYQRILDENSDTKNGSLVTAIEQSDRVELFLNGKKVAFIPPTKGKPFSEILNHHFNLRPEISFDLAIIESSTAEARSTSLQSLLESNEPITLSAGEKYHLFETSFLKSNFENSDRMDTTNSTNRMDVTQTRTATRVVDWTVLKRLFARANVIQVKLDEKIWGFLPETTESLSTSAAEMLLYDNTGSLSDLVLIESRDKSNSTVFTSSSIIYETNKNLETKPIAVHLFLDETIKNIINNGKSELLSKIQDTSVSLYINFELNSFGPADNLNNKSSKLSRRINDANVYPLFLLHRTRISNQNYWKTNVISISDFSDQKFIDKIQPRDQIFVFTDTFIKDLSLRGIISAEDDKNTDSDPNNEIMIADDVYKKSSADVTPRNSLIKRKKSSESDNFNLEEIIKLLKSYARFIGGAVGTPGSYPAANTISLSQLIDVAGGLTADADLQQVSITKFKIEKGRVVRDKVEKLDLKRTPDNQIVLSGMYNILIPPFINDVTTGVITLVGEVERPGQYVIGRDETLHKLIDRAGGFTSVAYPLGAIFTRESLKATQKEGYDLLARQVEEAILKISQSENKQGVGEQITAVLEYAKQLRQQKVSGRITVNILQDDKSAPVYLQDGDVLMIPKRPGHVSIIGSVQKNTVASYSESKRLSSYLASAGGTNRIADRSLTYIVLPNGESESVDNDSIIPPGSVIVVPPKTHSLSPLNFTETVSRILGNIALSFLAINNAR